MIITRKKALSLLPIIILSFACNNPSKPNDTINNKTEIKNPVIQGKVNNAVFDNKKISSIKVNLNSDLISILGKVLDSKTQKSINKKVSINIDGSDKDKFEKTTYTFENGEIKLSLKKGIKATAQNPLNFTIVAKSEGYFSSSTEFQLKDDKNNLFSINLVDINNPPVGVAALETKNNKADANGALVEKINLSINEPKSGSTLSVNLPANTILKDSEGKPLSGNVTANIGYFNNQSDSSFNAFPGGLNNATVDKNGKKETGYFMTGGFTSIELTDEKGNKAATFSNPMEITMQIPKGTINPDTGKEIKTGDKIGIWSYDTTTGQWKYETEGAVGELSNNNFIVKYTAQHLSYWNLDWHYDNKCNPKLRLIWNGSPIPVAVTAKFEGQYWSFPTTLRDEVNDLFNVPTDRNITFTAMFGNKEVGKTSIKLGESCPEIKLNISSESLPVMREIPVYVYLRSKTEFTFDEIKTLANNFGVSESQQKIMFDYFKNNNIKEPVALTDDIVSKLDAQGVKNLKNLKSLLGQKVSPSAPLYDSVENPYTWNHFNIIDGKASIRVMDGEVHNLSTYFYYKGKDYYLNQNVTITSDTKEVILEKIDTDLTISLVKDYFKEAGIDFSNIKFPS
ncbi:MAG: hypothetical protein U0457_14365 [Candidatus Sericytochromatia bacterium]